MREAKRQNIAYRSHAFKCLGRIATARPDLDLSEVTHNIVAPAMTEIRDAESEDVMDVDRENGKITESEM